MKRRHKAALAFPLLVLVYCILTVTERFLEGEHYAETIR